MSLRLGLRVELGLVGGFGVGLVYLLLAEKVCSRVYVLGYKCDLVLRLAIRLRFIVKLRIWIDLIFQFTDYVQGYDVLIF